MLAEQVDVVGEAVADVGDGAAFGGYDDDLRQRVLHTLPQLVRCRNRLLPERVLHEGEVGAEQQHVVVGLHIGQVGGPGQRELLVDPAAETERLYTGDVGFGGTEARLHQEARCFIRRRWRHGDGSGCRSRDGRWRRGRWSGRRAAATGAESDGQRTRQQCTAGGAGQGGGPSVSPSNPMAASERDRAPGPKQLYKRKRGVTGPGSVDRLRRSSVGRCSRPAPRCRNRGVVRHRRPSPSFGIVAGPSKALR